MKKTTAALLLTGVAGSAYAAPAFDRPGAGFNPEVLAPGSMIWEQGLPDVTRNKEDGTTSTLYQYDSRLRLGLTDQLEVQFFGDPYRRMTTSGAGDVDGPGNAGIALKMNIPTRNERASFGVMTSVEFNTGKAAFRNYGSDGKEARSVYLGVTGGWELNDRQSVAAYLDVTRTDEDDVYTFSPSWQTTLDEDWALYLEYKVSFGDLDDEDHLAGGGVTWMVTDKLQLDLYSDFGITSDSTDYESGFGVSYLIR
ncbi:hypothetical protein MA04_02980 [Alcanivorax balearicus MACL04]|uniref:Transporter n=1 Tax=Alloalcanivorax balearicus MACL04 TaxID=1177182 RepID=A0ABT2R1L4_9GAMM|nr:transporter [Alloalcanivorax balearicus]MCU5783680.1 hypothetical protein [Alloalcanivorax balearicus MACL04]